MKAVYESSKAPEAGKPWTVADFFCCGGGTSAGFSPRPDYRIVGAVDLEIAKPSGGDGASDCNRTYEANHGIGYRARSVYLLGRERRGGRRWLKAADEASGAGGGDDVASHRLPEGHGLALDVVDAQALGAGCSQSFDHTPA